jgi:osmoprotectant transport system ATP-binding protein
VGCRLPIRLPESRLPLNRAAARFFADIGRKPTADPRLVGKSDKMAMLELINVSKRYGDLTAIHPTDLALDAEKTYVLIGPSGCGKSTLLKITIGLARSDTGAVRVAGEELLDGNVLQLRQRIGYVIQDGGLFPHMTARENVTLVARHLRWESRRIHERLGHLAELTQFPPDGLDRYPTQLSGGQQQRVGLMRALMLDPDVLLMDEPLGALDPMIRKNLQTDLRNIFRGLNKTVMMVTHDLNEAAYFADEIILLRDGRIVQQGTIADLLNSPQTPFVTQFVNAQRSTLPGGEQ